jgi:mannobiose 2-epimerase
MVPACNRYEFGGYFTNISNDFNLMPMQEKMVVTQARHMWTTAKASEFFNNESFYNYSLHGFNFLKDKMWDSEYGGYYQIRSRAGGYSEVEKWKNESELMKCICCLRFSSSL